MALKANNGSIVVDNNQNLFLDKVYYNRLVAAAFQGQNYGYMFGGVNTSTFADAAIIAKFPFAASTTNAVSIGNLTVARRAGTNTGQKSNDYGYNAGGGAPGGPGSVTVNNTIDRFPFASDGNAADVGDLTVAKYAGSGQSSSSSGYNGNGNIASGAPVSATKTNALDKFPFAVATTNATDVADMTTAASSIGGYSSSDYGYSAGGGIGPTNQNVIDRFPFASDSNASDVGDLTVARSNNSGHSSVDYGFAAGGFIPSYVCTIDRFPFAVASVNATNTANLTYGEYAFGSQSSFDYGYLTGGTFNPPVAPVIATWRINRFPFASAVTNAGVGNLVGAVGYDNNGGTQS